MDLNSDVGEGFGPWPMGDDDAVLGAVTSANVACGFHGGDPRTARRTCESAARRGAVVGAHVGYRDLVGFGRRFVDVAPVELEDEVIYQIGALSAIARASGTAVRYVKPHGALYHAVAHHRGQARAVASAVATVDVGLPLLVLPGSVIEEEARSAGLRTVVEAFADRGYQSDGGLVPRQRAGAVLSDPAQVAARAVRMAREGVVESVDGQLVELRPESVCVHSDTPGAGAVARAVRSALEQAGVRVASFV